MWCTRCTQEVYVCMCEQQQQRLVLWAVRACLIDSLLQVCQHTAGCCECFV